MDWWWSVGDGGDRSRCMEWCSEVGREGEWWGEILCGLKEAMPFRLGLCEVVKAVDV